MTEGARRTETITRDYEKVLKNGGESAGAGGFKSFNANRTKKALDELQRVCGGLKRVSALLMALNNVRT